MLILCSIRNLKYLAPLMMIANVLELTSVGIIFYYITRDLPDVTTRPEFASWNVLPLYFGTTMYTFEGIGLILPIKNQMKRPKDLGGFFGVLNTAMVVITCLYIFMGFFGYLKFGNDVQGSITLNLPIHEPLAQAVIIMLSFAIFLSYSIQFYVPIKILLPWILKKIPNPKRHILAEYVFRFVLIIITCKYILVNELLIYFSYFRYICRGYSGFRFIYFISRCNEFVNFSASGATYN